MDVTQASPPRFAIEISRRNYQRLRFKHQQAPERSIIVTEDDSYVNAGSMAGGRPARVKIRLKGDFGDGRIEASSFESCGDDRIDVSQSETSIEAVRVEVAGDKGISIGERSRVEITSSWIARVKIGVACKESSRATINRLRIADSTTGIAAYRKKPEFSGGTVDARRVEVVGTATPYDSDTLSSISVGGRIVPGSSSPQVSSL